MSVELAKPRRTIGDADEAQALASAIIARTGIDEEFDAGSILENHPGLAQYRSVVVDLAYEEFCRRVDAGEAADPQEFAQRFPAVAHSLLKVLEVHQYLEHHPDAFAPESPPAWPQAGDEVSGFTLVREVGRGGFSRVFLAQEKDLGDREVVVKVCVQANEEAARLGRLDHPHIVPVHSVQSHSLPGFTVICMPYLGSATLADVIAEVFAAGTTRRRGADLLKAIELASQRHGFSASEQSSNPGRVHWTRRRGSYAEAILETGAEVCQALAYAHRQGICHCDVKPSNVLLTAEGRSLLLDFNLSTQRGGTAAVVGGTLPYMAPEQLRFVLAADPRSLPEIDYRADLFALGATMFHLLTGRLPFPVEDLPEDKRETARQLLDQQRNPVNLSGELEQVVSPGIARVITECLAFDPDDRPQSAEQVAQRFRDELGAVPRVQRWVRSHTAAVAGVATALILAAVAFGVYLATRPPEHVRQYELGVAHFEMGDYATARRCFGQALEARSDCVQTLVLGWVDLKASQREGLGEAERSRLQSSALKSFEESWKETESAASAASLAYCQTTMKDFDAAAVHFALAAELDLKTPAVLTDLGYCLARTKSLVAMAAERLEEAVRGDPKLQPARHNLAIVKWRLAQDAVRKARQARANGKEEAAANHEAEAADNLRAAMEHIDEARKCGPRSADLELDAATIYADASASSRGKSTPASDAQEHALLEEAWTSCEAAVNEFHLPPPRIMALAILAPKLGQDPRFQELLKATPSSTAPAPATLLVDVYPDIRDQLIGFRR